MDQRLIDEILESEIQQIPDKVLEFLHREPSPSGSGQTWGYYARGYSVAFEEVAEAALRDWPRREYLRLPIFFLGRHSMELSIKEAIDFFAAAVGLPERTKGHNLLNLWDELERLIDTAGYPREDWGEYCRKLIEHIVAIDPDGQRFRYPEDLLGTPFDFTRVEIEALIKAHYHVTTYSDACISMLHESMP